ncbi:MAG TPA: hypothetical protein VLB44_15460 [Kofleriaceae bacterium]|nr:hypothetical protein [Kofleriaceae bacterium]
MRTWSALLVLCASAPAHARKHPSFEPTDLELETSGTTEIDLQLGAVKGPDADRIVVPDFEIDVGILPRVELDLDGAYGVEGVPTGTPRFLDHSAPDNLWLSAKLGLWDHRDDDDGDAWAAGIQVGPKLPIASNTHGLGVEALALVGHMMGRAHLVGELGGLVDPRVGTTGRPYGVEGGLDLELELRKDTWSLLGELGGIYYGSADANQLTTAVGIQFSPSAKLDLSLVALVGFLDGSDPYGVLLGISPKFSLW